MSTLIEAYAYACHRSYMCHMPLIACVCAGAPKSISVETRLSPSERCRTWADAGLLLQTRTQSLLTRVSEHFLMYDSRRPRTFVMHWRVNWGASVARSVPFPSDIPLPVPEETIGAHAARLAQVALQLLQVMCCVCVCLCLCVFVFVCLRVRV